jgi:WD40 repeat protein
VPATPGFNPDGRRLATGGHDGITRVWDVNSGKEVLTLTGRTTWIFGIAFSPDGKQLVSTSFDGIPVWDASPVESNREPALAQEVQDQHQDSAEARVSFPIPER